MTRRRERPSAVSFKTCPPSSAHVLTEVEAAGIDARRRDGETLGHIAESFGITVVELEAQLRALGLSIQRKRSPT